MLRVVQGLPAWRHHVRAHLRVKAGIAQPLTFADINITGWPLDGAGVTQFKWSQAKTRGSERRLHSRPNARFSGGAKRRPLQRALGVCAPLVP